jgi:hypothetical protein
VPHYTETSTPTVKNVKIESGLTKVGQTTFRPNAELKLWFRFPVEWMNPQIHVKSDGGGDYLMPKPALKFDGRSVTLAVPGDNSYSFELESGDKKGYIESDPGINIRARDGETVSNGRDNPILCYVTIFPHVFFKVFDANFEQGFNSPVAIWVEFKDGSKSAIVTDTVHRGHDYIMSIWNFPRTGARADGTVCVQDSLGKIYRDHLRPDAIPDDGSKQEVSVDVVPD